MRLIDTSTYGFEEFMGREVPPYAILSHTWGEEEVSYEDYIQGNYHRMKGFAKILKTCESAKKAGIRYAWVDTCCIDKRSSAELTEAINSMFIWYERSVVCYVFLFDLEPDIALEKGLSDCRWLRRGWTLQELIAPSTVYFLDRTWRYRGAKDQMGPLLASITGIDKDILLHTRSVADVCVAQRMSWASCRETTRAEDIAYCLLGIFQVNVALLYGEGEKMAFRRLQEEIVKSMTDLSLFAWKEPAGADVNPYSGILASSPRMFSSAGTVSMSFDTFVGEYSFGNNAIKIGSQILANGRTGTHDFSYILLLCCNDQGTELGVKLRKVGANTFIRDDPCTLFETPVSSHYYGYAGRQLLLRLECPALWNGVSGYVMQPIFTARSIALSRQDILRIELLQPELRITAEWDCFDGRDQCFFTTSYYSSAFAALVVELAINDDDVLDLGTSRYPFRFVLFVIDWTSIRHWENGIHEWRQGALKYYLVPFDTYRLQLANMLPICAQAEGMSVPVADLLESMGIKMSRSLNVPGPFTWSRSEVAVDVATISDERIFPKKFPRLRLSYEIKQTNRSRL